VNTLRALDISVSVGCTCKSVYWTINSVLESVSRNGVGFVYTIILMTSFAFQPDMETKHEPCVVRSQLVHTVSPPPNGPTHIWALHKVMTAAAVISVFGTIKQSGRRCVYYSCSI